MMSFWGWLFTPAPRPNRKLTLMEWLIRHKKITSFFF